METLIQPDISTIIINVKSQCDIKEYLFLSETFI